MTPLAGMRVEKRGAVHLARRTMPVQAKGQRRPARLRTEFFLTDVVTPAATRLTNTAAHHQHIDDAAIIHVHVVPVVQTRADDDHALAVRLVRILCEFARHLNHHFGFDAGVFFLPFGRVWNVLHVVGRDRITGKLGHASVHAVVRHQQIKYRCHQDRRAIGQSDAARRHFANLDVFGIRFVYTGEILKAHFGHSVVFAEQAELRFDVSTIGIL